MEEKAPARFEDLLKNPEVQKIISNINPELVERRAYQPSRCEVFQNRYTVLKDTDRYRFDIDGEARRQLQEAPYWYCVFRGAGTRGT